MNSAQELHIAVRQGIEKLESFQDEHALPEEIDLQLNRAQDRYVEYLINNRFEDTQTRLDHLSSLIVRNKSLAAIVPSSTDVDFEPNSVYGILPADYKDLINDRSTVICSTRLPLCNDLGVVPTAIHTEYIAQLEFPTTALLTGPLFNRPRILVNGIEVYVTPTAIGAFNNENSKFVIINDILETINGDETLPYEVYWERYRNVYRRNTFFFVSTDNSLDTQPVVINIFESDGSTVDSSTNTTFTGTDYNIYNGTSIIDSQVTVVPNRLTEKEELYNFLSTNTFYRTKKNEPISALTNRITIFIDKSFIISNISIDYIRKPRQISLSLEQSCELSESGCRKVVDMTVEYFKLIFENPNYSGIVQDNNLRNQII